MLRIFLISLLLIISLNSCAKKKDDKLVSSQQNPYNVYEEGLEAFNKNDYFFAHKKFSESEIIFEDLQLAAKASVMSSYSLYAINFYSEALENIERFLKIYPADKNVIYVNYLKAIIFYEQIGDEKRDIEPLIKAGKQIDFFLNEYPNSEYAIDLKFKKDLIENQLAAKEIYIAKFYISTQKWVPAINRLKKVVKDYDKTIFIEEALHRLVEIHYHIGLEEEAKKYASILGYNYNSSEWFQQSYKIFNKDYEEIKKIEKDEKKSKNFIKGIIEMIK